MNSMPKLNSLQIILHTHTVTGILFISELETYSVAWISLQSSFLSLLIANMICINYYVSYFYLKTCLHVSRAGLQIDRHLKMTLKSSNPLLTKFLNYSHTPQFLVCLMWMVEREVHTH